MPEAMGKWLLFSLLLGLVPIGAAVLWRYLRAAEFSVAHAVRHGELLLLTAMLNAAAIGDVLGAGRRHEAAMIGAAGCAVLVLLLGSLIYAFIAAQGTPATPAEVTRISRVSRRLFLAGVLTSACCVGIGSLT